MLFDLQFSDGDIVDASGVHRNRQSVRRIPFEVRALIHEKLSRK